MKEKLIQIVMIWVKIAMLLLLIGVLFHEVSSHSAYASTPVSKAKVAGKENQKTQWFKDQMKIADKYVQKGEGIWGMSWAHFFTMVFLSLFVIAAIAVFIHQQKKTKEIIDLIRKEVENGNSSGV